VSSYYSASIHNISRFLLFYLFLSSKTSQLQQYEQVKLLFAGERKVCDQIFEGFDSLSEQCFAEVTTNSVSMLLSFGEAIAKSKRSPEKLFVLLDMYEIMQELHSEVWLLTYKIINLNAISLLHWSHKFHSLDEILYLIANADFLFLTTCRLKHFLKAKLALQ